MTNDRTSPASRTLQAPRPLIAAAGLLIALIFATFHTPAQAQSFENLERLDGLVTASLGANRGEPGGPIAPIDRRLRLAQCPQTPVVDAPRMGAATVSCPSIGWRIRVPLTPNRQAATAANSGGYATENSAPVVKKGDPVQLVAGNDSFSISRLMIADEDGAVGALIRVRQEARAAPVMARVERMGVVRIPGI